MKKRYILLLLALFSTFALSASDKGEGKAKYVFYFIGDGMGFSHIAAAEYYSYYMEHQEIGSKPLSFTQFPVMGMAVSHSASNNITCSSAAGTALATGYKTNNGFLGVAPDSTDLESIAYKAHNNEYGVGIISNVSLDHATPASFYASWAKRSDYYSIAVQMSRSDFPFFAGGGFIEPRGKNNNRGSAYEMLKKENYVIAAGLEEFEQAYEDDAERIVLLQKEGVNSHELPYAIDRKEGDMKLSDLVKAAVKFFEYQYEDGFFLMTEGGRIDWAAHSNDAKSTILEVLDLSDAVAVAYEFYKECPDQTLIVVTADHETGGISLGREKGYSMFFDKFDDQNTSKDNTVSATSYEAGTGNGKEQIDQMNKDAKIGWTTSSHTAGNVPVFAIGAGSELFAGRMDNTDIPKKICEAMGIEF